jgi:hypothetical protein
MSALEGYPMAPETPSRIQIIVALIGLAGVLTAAVIAKQCGGSSQNNSNFPSPIPAASNTPPVNSGNTPVPPNIKPDKLIEIIKQQQEKNVRLSYGEEASQNFSSVDLANFVREKTTAKIAEELKGNNEFLDTVSAVKAMPPAERQKLLDRAAVTYKPTWAQLGKIDPSGQTEAGQRAERMIAEAIVNLVKELSKLPEADFRKLYT